MDQTSHAALGPFGTKSEAQRVLRQTYKMALGPQPETLTRAEFSSRLKDMDNGMIRVGLQTGRLTYSDLQKCHTFLKPLN